MKAKQPSDFAFAAAAWMLDCEEPAIRAVAAVESSAHGAFLDSDEPVLLFERHHFHRRTAGRWSPAHPEISNPRPGGYGKVSEQHERLRKAADLDRAAALKSASWGLFQIMGFNYQQAGHASLQSFINGMYSSADAHLRAFVWFIAKDERLLAAIQQLEWKDFALIYNGPRQADHDYAGRIAAAYRAAKLVADDEAGAAPETLVT